VAGIRRKPKGKGKRALYQGWFIDHTGKRRFFTGTASRSETLRIAQDAETEHRKIRLGYLPAPETVERYEEYPFADTLTEYLAWGEAQGGRGGRPWGREHARKRRERLNWWQNRLTLGHLSNLDGSLARVEAALRELQAGGRAGKTVSNYAEALAAFCDWCANVATSFLTR
jgi:hypothetical protein